MNTTIHKGITPNADIVDKFSPYKKALGSIKLYTESEGYANVLVHEDKAKALRDKVSAPLKAEIREVRKAMGGAVDHDTKFLLGETLQFMEGDLKHIEGRLEQTTELYAEASFWGDIAPYQTAVMPWQYLETIANTAKYIVDFENTTTPTIPLVRKVRYVEVNGKEWKLPYCYKEPTFWEDILATGNLDFPCAIDPSTITGGAFNLVETQTKYSGKVKGKDPLIPYVAIKKITVEDIPEVIIVPQTQDVSADLMSRGKFHVVVQNATADKTYSLSGKVDFRTGNVEISTTGNIKNVEFSASFSGETMRQMSTMRVEQEDHYITLQDRVHFGMTFEKGQLAAKMSLENIDALVEGTAIMYELADGAKDYSAIKHIDDCVTWLKSGALENANAGSYKESGHAYYEKEYSTVATGNYRPATEIEWRRDMLPETIDKMGTAFKTHLNSKKGVLNVIYGNPNLTREIPETKLIISDGREYGGVKNEGQVLTARIGNNSYRIVETERKGYDPEDYTNNALRMVPKSGMETQKTFAMYQWISYLTKDGSYRSASNPLLPAAVMVDNFGVDHVHAIVGDIKYNTGA